MRIINSMERQKFPAKRWRASLRHTVYKRDLDPCLPSDRRAGCGGRGVEARPHRPGGLVPLDVHLSAMRESGMSQTAIRRALGLSEDQAVAAGLIPPKDVAADGTPAEPEPEAQAKPSRNRRHRGQGACVLPDGPRAATGQGRTKVPGPEMDEVLEAVARLGDITREDLLGPRHDRHRARRRHLAMYLMRELCSEGSLSAIGVYLRRDHTTVLHGCRRAAALLDQDTAFRELHDRVRAELTP